MNRLQNKLLLTLTLTLAALAASVRASNVSWNATTGDWSNGANWSTSGTPASSDTVYVNNGGTVTVSSSVNSTNAYLGYTSGSAVSGNAIVSGTAVWNNSNSFILGNYANNTASVQVSGSAKVLSKTTAIGKSGNGTLTISDHGSWVNSGATNGNFTIGNASSGTGTLNLTDYALLQNAGSVYLGGAAGTGHGILNVSDNASVITTWITITNDSVVNLSGNASVISGSTVGILFYKSQNATLNILSDKVKITGSDGTTTVHIDDAGSQGIVNFNHRGNLTFANVISGSNIAVNAVSGTTTLTGSNVHSSTTVDSGAKLVAGNANALGSGTGGVLVNSGGILALGTDVHALTLGGDLTIHGTLSLEVGDVITGSGALLLDGSLSIDASDIDLAALDKLNLNDFFSGFASKDYSDLDKIIASINGTLYQGTKGDDGSLTFESVPEPSAYFLLALGLGTLWFTARRRKFVQVA